MADRESTSSTIVPKMYSCTALIESGRKLYLDTETADVHFSIGSADGTVKRIAAHKNILAAASDDFHKMFYAESKVKGDVHVSDVSDAAFMEFLQFFYRTQICLTIENITDVMHLGHKYNVPKSIKVCVEFLKDKLTVDNVFIGLDLAIRYDHQELKQFCSKFITLNTVAVFQTAGFLECDREAMAFILGMNILSCTEIEVFNACMAWVQAKSKQSVVSKAMVKKHLGNLYYEIRFASMTMPEFCSLETGYEQVLRNDFAEITNMIVLQDFQSENFNTEPRHTKWNANAIVDCDFRLKNSNESPHVLWNKHTTTFSSEKPLLLGNITCSKIRVKGKTGIRDLSVMLAVKVEIFEVRNSNDANAKSLMTMNTKLKSTDDNRIWLPHPILIRPGFRYKIRIGPFPDEHVYYCHGLKTKVSTFVDHDFLSFNGSHVKLHNCTVDDDKTIGLISNLQFNAL